MWWINSFAAYLKSILMTLKYIITFFLLLTGTTLIAQNK